jgi:hypothetical protein
MSDLVKGLASLGLRHTAGQLDDVVALATKRRWSPTQLLEHLVESEQQERTPAAASSGACSGAASAASRR